MEKTVPTNKARQGRLGRQVLYVLLGSLILAMVVWAGVEMYGEQIDRPAAATSEPAD